VVVLLSATVTGRTTRVTLRAPDTGRVYLALAARSELGLERAMLQAERACVERGYVLWSPAALSGRAQPQATATRER
jgi:hypothetical protein